MSKCGSCEVEIDPDSITGRTVPRLIASLDDNRRAIIAQLFGGEVPPTLCAECFNRTASVFNASIGMRRATPDTQLQAAS